MAPVINPRIFAGTVWPWQVPQAPTYTSNSTQPEFVAPEHWRRLCALLSSWPPLPPDNMDGDPPPLA